MYSGSFPDPTVTLIRKHLDWNSRKGWESDWRYSSIVLGSLLLYPFMTIILIFRPFDLYHNFYFTWKSGRNEAFSGHLGDLSFSRIIMVNNNGLILVACLFVCLLACLLACLLTYMGTSSSGPVWAKQERVHDHSRLLQQFLGHWPPHKYHLISCSFEAKEPFCSLWLP